MLQRNQIFLAVALFFAGMNFGRADEPRAVRIAVNLPLSCDLAVFGKPRQEGFTLALQDLREKNSSRPFAVDWQDNQGRAASAKSIAVQQLAEHTDIYISGLKPQSLAIFDELRKRGIPHFIWAWDSTLDPALGNLFRTWLNFSLEANAIALYAQERKPSRVAIAYVQIPGNTETHYQQVVAPQMRSSGASEVTLEPYSLDETDFHSLALRLKKSGADLFVINGFPHQLIGLIRALSQLRLISPGNTFASMDVLDASANMPVPEIEGIVTAAPTFLVNRTQMYSDWG